MKKYYQFIEKHSIKSIIFEIILPYFISFYYRLRKQSLKIYSIKVKSNKLEFKMFLEITGLSKIPMIDTILLRRLGIYEPKTSKLLSEVLRPGFVVVELGAAYGYFTIQMSQLIGKTGKIYSFEPNKFHYDILEKNLLLNNLQNSKIYNCGIGKKNKTLVDGSDQKFKTKTTSELFDGLKKIDFIFIDIDAKNTDGTISRQEFPVIEDLLKFCKKKKATPCYFVEYINKDRDYSKILSLFNTFGYSYEIITDRHFYFSRK